MPRETIGTAFVRIIADGKGLGKSIKKEFANADGDVQDAAEHHSDVYNKAFAAKQKKNQNITKSMVRSLDRAFAAMSADADFLGKNFQKNLAEKLTTHLEKVGKDTEVGQRAKEIGERTAQNIADGFAKSGIAPNLNSGLRKEIQKAFDDILKEERDFEREWRKEMEKIDRETERISKNIVTSLDSERTAVNRLGDSLKKLGRTIKHDVTKEFITLSTQSRKVRDELLKQHLLLPRVNRGWGFFADKVGVFTGRGSRNNFLNFIGSMSRNLTNLIGIIPKAIAGIIDFGRTVAAKGLLGALGGISGILKFITAGAAAMAGAVVILTFVIGPLIAALSMMLGVLIALASTITFAFLGALAAVATTLIPFIAGIGVVTAAILSMDDAMKKTMKEAIEPFVNQMKALGELAAEELFRDAPEQAERLTEIMRGLRRMVRGVAVAMSDVADFFLDMMESPGFREFVRQFSNVLPGMVRRLGHIFAQTLGGLGGIFVAAIPITQRFLLWLDRITERFSDWANSPKGQQEMLAFFEKAGDSARSLGNFLREATELLATLLGGTNTAGNNIFDSMADAMERFNNFLKANPDAMADWAADAEEFAKAIGNAAVEMGKLIDELDDEQSRETLNTWINGFVTLTGWISATARGIETVTDFLLELDGLTNGDWLMAGLEGIVNGLAAAFEWLGESLRGLFNIEDPAGGGMLIQLLDVEAAARRVGRLLERIPKLIQAIGTEVLKIPGASATAKVLGDVVRLLGDPPALIRVINAMTLRIPGLSVVLKLAGDLVRLLGDPPALIRAINSMTLRIPGLSNVIGLVNDAISAVNDLRYWVDLLVGAIGRINWPDPPGWLSGAGGAILDKLTASGGIFVGAQHRIIGEAGAEAVVPLNRPLGQVDPAVRALSAFAQGLRMPGMASGGIAGGGRSIDASGWTIVSPGDPEAVAQEALNRLAAAAYI